MYYLTGFGFFLLVELPPWFSSMSIAMNSNVDLVSTYIGVYISHPSSFDSKCISVALHSLLYRAEILKVHLSYSWFLNESLIFGLSCYSFVYHKLLFIFFSCFFLFNCISQRKKLSSRNLGSLVIIQNWPSNSIKNTK